MEVLEIPPEVRLVALPCHPVDTGGGFAFERVERRPERILADACARLGADVVRYCFIVVACTTYSLPVSRRTCVKTCAQETSLKVSAQQSGNWS